MNQNKKNQENPNPTEAPDWRNSLPQAKIQKPPKRVTFGSVAALIVAVGIIGAFVFNLRPVKQFRKEFSKEFQKALAERMKEEETTESQIESKPSIKTEEKEFKVDIDAARFGYYEKYKPDDPKPAGKHEVTMAEGYSFSDSDNAITIAKQYLTACDTKDYTTLSNYSDLEVLTYLASGQHISNEQLPLAAASMEQTFTTIFKASAMDDCIIAPSAELLAVFQEFFEDKGEMYESMRRSFSNSKPFNGYYKIDAACIVKSKSSQNFIALLHINGSWKISLIMKISMDALGITNPYAVEAPTKAEQPTNVNGELMTGEESARAAAAMFIRACKAKDYATLSKITNLESLMYALTGTHYSEDQMALATKNFAKNTTMFDTKGFEGTYDVENAVELLLDYQEFYNDEGQVAEALKNIYAEQGVNYTGFKGQYECDGAAYLITPTRKLVLLHLNGAWVVEVVYADATKKQWNDV